jgi:hypothetical protein
VDLTAPRGVARVRVTFTEESAILVRTSLDGTRFLSQANRLGIESAAGDTIDVRIPRGSSRVEIVSGGRVLFLWNGSVTVTENDPELDGSTLIEIETPSP